MPTPQAAGTSGVETGRASHGQRHTAHPREGQGRKESWWLCASPQKRRGRDGYKYQSIYLRQSKWGRDGTQWSQCKGRKHHGEVKAKEELCTILPGCIGHRMIPPVLGPFSASTQGRTLMDKPVTLTQVFLAAPHAHNRLTGHHTPCAGIAKCHNNHSQLFPMPPAAPSHSVQETTAQLDIPSSEPAVPIVLPGTCSPMAPAAAPTLLTWAF